MSYNAKNLNLTMLGFVVVAVFVCSVSNINRNNQFASYQQVRFDDTFSLD